VLVVIGAAIGAFSGHHGSSSGTSSGGGGGSAIRLVAGQSFCVPSGIDDVYTGNGHVTFYLTFRNSGASDGSVDATPVRHYDDGEENESPMDMITVDVPAGTTQKVRTDAMTYKAHQHDIVQCGVQIDGRETPIQVQ
jgi:hypothetical protein